MRAPRLLRCADANRLAFGFDMPLDRGAGDEALVVDRSHRDIHRLRPRVLVVLGELDDRRKLGHVTAPVVDRGELDVDVVAPRFAGRSARRP